MISENHGLREHGLKTHKEKKNAPSLEARAVSNRQVVVVSSMYPRDGPIEDWADGDSCPEKPKPVLSRKK